MATIAIQDKKGRKFIKKLLDNTLIAKERKREYIATLSVLVFQNIMDHFEQEEGPGGPWKAWSKVYDEHMQKIGKGGNKILQDTGRLRQSFTPRNVRRVSDGILWFNPAKTKKGFPYAAHHDETRTFMWLSPGILEDMAGVTLNFLFKS